MYNDFIGIIRLKKPSRWLIDICSCSQYWELPNIMLPEAYRVLWDRLSMEMTGKILALLSNSKRSKTGDLVRAPRLKGSDGRSTMGW